MVNGTVTRTEQSERHRYRDTNRTERLSTSSSLKHYIVVTVTPLTAFLLITLRGSCFWQTCVPVTSPPPWDEKINSVVWWRASQADPHWESLKFSLLDEESKLAFVLVTSLWSLIPLPYIFQVYLNYWSLSRRTSTQVNAECLRNVVPLTAANRRLM